MTLKYSVLRASAEDNTNLKVVSSEFNNHGAALKAAKKWRAEQVEAHGSWADSFYVAPLEEV